MQRYTSTLVQEETNLSQLLEEAIKTIQKEDEAEAEEDEDIVDDEDDIAEVEKELKEEDYDEFNDFLEQDEIDDQLLTDFLTGSDV